MYDDTRKVYEFDIVINGVYLILYVWSFMVNYGTRIRLYAGAWDVRGIIEIGKIEMELTKHYVN